MNNQGFRLLLMAFWLLPVTKVIADEFRPALLFRIHGMRTGEIGTYLALFIGVGAAIVICPGGHLADLLAARHGEHWLP